MHFFVTCGAMQCVGTVRAAHCCALQLFQRALCDCRKPTGGKKGIAWNQSRRGLGGEG